MGTGTKHPCESCQQKKKAHGDFLRLEERHLGNFGDCKRGAIAGSRGGIKRQSETREEKRKRVYGHPPPSLGQSPGDDKFPSTNREEEEVRKRRLKIWSRDRGVTWGRQ